jgi:hypothetical protein
VDGCQPDIPRASAVLTSAFQVIEECANEGSIKVFDPELAELDGSNRDIPQSYVGSLVVDEADGR